MIKLAVVGSTGRVGKEVVNAAKEDSRFSLTSLISSKQQTLDPQCEIAIDFSTPEGTKRALSWGIPLVIGTTGLDAETMEEIARREDVFYSPNYSQGMLLLFSILPNFSQIPLHLIETHREGKKDLPGGSAKYLAQLHGNDVEIESRREKDNKGEHELTFSFPGEKLVIKHLTLDRKAYALGALNVAIKMIENKRKKGYDSPQYARGSN